LVMPTIPPPLFPYPIQSFKVVIGTDLVELAFIPFDNGVPLF